MEFYVRKTHYSGDYSKLVFEHEGLSFETHSLSKFESRELAEKLMRAACNLCEDELDMIKIFESMTGIDYSQLED